jgi:hypothetical protein
VISVPPARGRVLCEAVPVVFFLDSEEFYSCPFSAEIDVVACVRTGDGPSDAVCFKERLSFDVDGEVVSVSPVDSFEGL